MDIKEDIKNIINKHIKCFDTELEIPPDPKLGDLAMPCFSFAKAMKKSPVEISKELSEKIKPEGILKSVESKGSYLNFYLDKQRIADNILPEILSDNMGIGSKEDPEKIVVEYVSPNTNKCLHLGHVRNGLLGEALSRVLEKQGHKVFRVSLNNDRGLGVSEAMLGYKMFHKGEEPEEKPDHFVARCYVDFKKALKDDPCLEDKAKELLVSWEKGDKDTIKLWKKMMSWVYEGYKKTFKDLGLTFDKQYYESEIYKEGKDIVNEGLKKGIFKIKDGAVIAELGKFKLPDKVLIKSDKTSLYITQDLYLANLKEKDFGMDRSIYVVGSEQDNHFRQLFKILEMIGFKNYEKCYHLSYGLVNLPSGRMKSREGNVVDADDLIQEVISLAKEEVIKRYNDLKEDEITKRSNIIGMAALKFFMLKYDNNTSFTYDPKESLSFEGETGPYVLYAYARISSILKKSDNSYKKADYGLLKDEKEEALIMLLNRYKDILSQSAKDYKPMTIARYLIDLSQKFNEFYNSCPILKADKDLIASRLDLIRAVRAVIKDGLDILGIQCLEEM